MPKYGPNKKTTPDHVYELLESGRPVWTSSSLADELNVSRPTIDKLLEEIEDDERLESMQVGNTEAYYLEEGAPKSLEEEHIESIIEKYSDRFVGLETAPWTAVHPNDGPAEAGDKIQLQVRGEPGSWSMFRQRHWDDRREQLEPGEIHPAETHALVSGTLYSKPTTPIEHIEYPDDYELERNIGLKMKDTEKGQVLIAGGVKNYLIRPCDDAVFLTDVSVDWISVKDPDEELETYGFVEVEEGEEIEEWMGGNYPDSWDEEGESDE